ncbi:hypothetical protein UM399_18335 (plasmid) [Sulfitobacter pontiacus]|uniref:hypothetical protein n=1 Tax=Sulfitobacter pontiacus TaxID=60137 RepID=UPI002AC9655F|nr:hypothetical protein [Sulfitobacter pontiacus]WPZ27596.1 hypothetical protein UM399_18335 [Sulfitobacter pontiacus]
MSYFEVFLSVISVVVSASGLFYVHWIVKTSGRDRPNDPAAVLRLIEKSKKTSASQTGQIRDT